MTILLRFDLTSQKPKLLIKALLAIFIVFAINIYLFRARFTSLYWNHYEAYI